jgi:D-alanyl-lipoteichoic acid acyltransferase DltB (MBOAT superfamily)
MDATLYIYNSTNFSSLNSSECVCTIYTSSTSCKLTDAEIETLVFGAVFLFIAIGILLAIIFVLYKSNRTRDDHLH